MGWADALIKLNIPYNSEDAVYAAEEIMEFIQFHSKKSSIRLSVERGPFPKYKNSIFGANPDSIIQRGTKKKIVLEGRPTLDWEQLRDELKTNGIRNATVTTIAPTGSLGAIASVSHGIEPNFGIIYSRLYGDRRIRIINPQFKKIINKLNIDSDTLDSIEKSGKISEISSFPQEIRNMFVTTYEISYEWHVKMQAAFQKFVDNAIAKTINLPKTATRDDIASAFFLAHELKCKGITVYRNGSRGKQVIDVANKDDQEGLQQKLRNNPIGDLPAKSYSAMTPTGRMYIFVRELDEKPFDIFLIIGRAGSVISHLTEAIGRLLSICLRSEIPIKVLSEQLKNLGGPSDMPKMGHHYNSVPDAIGRFLEKKYLESEQSDLEKSIGFDSASIRAHEFCPKCRNFGLVHNEGCLMCVLCGHKINCSD